MNSRIDAIKRLAETDGYWAAYVDGMNDTRAVRARDDEFAETNRLLQARLDRVSERRESWDDDWTPVPCEAPAHGRITS